MGKKPQTLEKLKDQQLRRCRLKAQLLAADALFEATRSGERGEPFAQVLEVWMDWFMSEGRVKEEGAEDH